MGHGVFSALYAALAFLRAGLYNQSMKIVHSVADSLKTGKGQDIVLVFVLILLSIGSFALGRLSVQGDLHPTVEIVSSQKLTADAAVAAPKATAPVSLTKASAGEKYVASKSGSAYHFPWCSGAQRIKEENKIYFSSKEEAEKAGYHPAGNCKGL